MSDIDCNKYRTTTSESNKIQSFSKADRLKLDIKKGSEPNGHDQNFPFDKQDTFSKRVTSFGQGTKSDFTRELRDMIDPGTYRIAGISEMNKSHGKGFGFGTPRDNMKNTLKNNLQIDRNIPGPANYRDRECQLADGRYKVTFSGRVAPSSTRFKVLDDRIIKNFPGPGTHDPTITLLDNSGGPGGSGRYLLSRNMSARTTRINPPHKSSGESRDKVPGPGNQDYKFSETIKSDGKQTLSKHKNSGVRSFGKSARDTLGIRAQTPGPGQQNPCNSSDFIRGKQAPGKR